MQELVKQVKAAGAIGSDTAIAAHLKELGYSALVSEVEAQEIAQDFNKANNGSGAIAPAAAKSLPSTQRTMSKRGGKGKTAIAKGKAEQQQAIGFEAVIEDVRLTVARGEAVAQSIEDAATEYLADTFASVPYNVQARVIEEVNSRDAGSFCADLDAWSESLRVAGGAGELFAYLQGSDMANG